MLNNQDQSRSSGVIFRQHIIGLGILVGVIFIIYAFAFIGAFSHKQNKNFDQKDLIKAINNNGEIIKLSEKTGEIWAIYAYPVYGDSRDQTVAKNMSNLYFRFRKHWDMEKTICIDLYGSGKVEKTSYECIKISLKSRK